MKVYSIYFNVDNFLVSKVYMHAITHFKPSYNRRKFLEVILDDSNKRLVYPVFIHGLFLVFLLACFMRGKNIDRF